MPFLSASFSTGTTRPLGVSAAKPMWKYCFSTSVSPSKLLLNCGNFFNADTHALMRNASIVTFVPDFSFSLFNCRRKASKSVMSASSCDVTAGIITALRSKFAPLIFWIRPSSLRSIAPNLAKSTFGHGINPNPAPSFPLPALALTAAAVAAAIAWVCAVPAITDLVKFCTSSCVIRPLCPVPLTSVSGTPSSRANLRTEGEACGNFAGFGFVGDAGNAVAVGAETAGVAGAATELEAANADAAGATAGIAPTDSTSKTTEPSLTRSPIWTFISFTTPAWLLGISMLALSLSTVIRLCSTAMVSPTLTNNSITATSLKSPISGTRTSTTEVADVAATGAGAATELGATDADTAGATAGIAPTAPTASNINTSEPSLTRSPSWTFISLITPAWLLGISIEALSLSTVIRL